MKTFYKILLSLLLVLTITGCSAANNGLGLGKEIKHTFKLSNEGLAEETYYVISRNVLEYEHIVAHDRMRVVCSLQGLLNRNMAKNHVALLIEPASESEKFWAEYMTKERGPLEGMERKDISTWDEFLSTFKNQLIECGMILWDPIVPATANVAATICGIKGYLPVKDIDESVKKDLLNLGVKVKQTLTNMFIGRGKIPDTDIDSTGSSKNDAYIWAMEHYMDDCSDQYIMCVPDGASSVSGNAILENNYESQIIFGMTNISSHDYGIARGMFFIDLSPFSNERPCDDPYQPLGGDLATLKKILQRRYDNASGEFGCMVGMPPWQIKYTEFQGMGRNNSVDLENEFVKYATQYNMFVDGDCSSINTSVYYQFKLKKSYKNGSKNTGERYKDNTLYVYYDMGGYNTTKGATNNLLTAFNDEKRGELPISFGINPGLADRIPMVFDYIYENITKNDIICASTNGIGYVNPQELFILNEEEKAEVTETDKLRTLPSGGDKYVKASKSYFNKFDIDLISSFNGKIDNNITEIYNKITPAGCFFTGHISDAQVNKKNAYLPIVSYADRVNNIEATADDLYSYWENGQMGNFLAVKVTRWTPTDVVEVTEALEKLVSQKKPRWNVKVVSGYNYIDLVKKAEVIEEK